MLLIRDPYSMSWEERGFFIFRGWMHDEWVDWLLCCHCVCVCSGGRVGLICVYVGWCAICSAEIRLEDWIRVASVDGHLARTWFRVPAWWQCIIVGYLKKPDSKEFGTIWVGIGLPLISTGSGIWIFRAVDVRLGFLFNMWNVDSVVRKHGRTSYIFSLIVFFYLRIYIGIIVLCIYLFIDKLTHSLWLEKRGAWHCIAHRLTYVCYECIWCLWLCHLCLDVLCLSRVMWYHSNVET